MAFNVLAIVGTQIPTAKDSEFINVQVVQVTNPKGEVRNRVEARLFCDNPGGYSGPTKTALVFDSESGINSLIAALEAAKGQVALGTLAPVKPIVKARKASPAAKVVKARKAG